jgi:hypothetical protein
MFQWARLVSLNGILTFPNHDYGFGALLFLFAKLLPNHDALWIFLIAVTAIAAKLYCFRRYAPAYWVALMVHVALFFVAHDYTQLRATLAIAFLMLGAGWLVSRSHHWMAAGSWLLAAGFHGSSIFAMAFAGALALSLPLYLGGVALSVSASQWIALASPHVERVAIYMAQAANQEPPNLLSSLKIYQYLTLGIFFHFRSEIRQRGWKMVEFSGWFLLAGLAIFFGLVRVPVLAHRLSELFLAFLPFLVSGVYLLMPRWLGIPYVGAALVIGAWGSYRILF